MGKQFVFATFLTLPGKRYSETAYCRSENAVCIVILVNFSYRAKFTEHCFFLLIKEINEKTHKITFEINKIKFKMIFLARE